MPWCLPDGGERLRQGKRVKKGRIIFNNMLEVMLELKGAEPLFIISRSHCAGASNVVFTTAVGLPGIINAEKCNC